MLNWREDDNLHPNKSTGAYGNPQPSAFSTDMVFNSRQDLIDWVRNVAFSLGFVIVIKRSKSDSCRDPCKVVLQCDCGGIHKGNKTSSKHIGTRKTNCPFCLVGKHLGNDCWTLTAKCEAHNHDFALHLEGHAYARRVSETQARLVEDLSANNVKPRDILSTIKQQYPDNVFIKKTIYNQCQKLRLKKNAGRTPMQVVMLFLQDEGYVYYRANDSTNKLEDLFFAHHRSLKIWHAFPHVLLMDATYKTNMFKMPLLEIVGVTSTNKTFCVAFVFMYKEKISNYTWALNCLQWLME
ncbi:protein FAR1-RELATED SEQUENCE 5-like [Cynara cardunculus var. scolymus]|uniref:protein FAR1-RELATED SEQUENCE 5-like n=1 Tax=Cynara cardunculus var. scolymus TaxID=59895 RepID=UPI000D626DE3|nr:protein FAR1-RELATED SEQUENCE 5-like [Cynara cardunculus var. scolymus]